MAGTKRGGQLAAMTNKAKYGPDFYRRIGSQGGKLGTTGGFASEHRDRNGRDGQARASHYGAIGGRISRKSKRRT